MRTDIKRILFAIAVFSVLSITSHAQVRGPSETKKQAEAEIKSEQKKQKEKRRRYEKVADTEIAELEQKPKYKRITRKRERLLLKPVTVTKERKN